MTRILPFFSGLILGAIALAATLAVLLIFLPRCLVVAKRHCPDCRLEERQVVWLEDSVDTRTDAQLTLEHCRQDRLQKVMIVTSPYHSRRAQFVFNDIYAGSGISTTVLSSDNFGNFLPPHGQWWRDRKTVEAVWLEFGKILYWKLTPFTEWIGP